MRLSIRWKHHAADRRDCALTRLQAVLESASHTAYYRPWMEAARLVGAGRIESLASVSEALACIPRVDMTWFTQHAGAFRNAHCSAVYQPPLEHPFTPQPRTAILQPGYAETGETRCISPDDGETVGHFAPESLAGPIDELLHLARLIRRGRLALNSIRHSLVVFRPIASGLLSETDRSALWHAFHVPVFEQLRGPAGELIASECDAHLGLHLCPRDAILEVDPSRRSPELLFTSLAALASPVMRLATGWSPRIGRDPCACGSGLPRLLDLTAVQETKAFAQAAS